MPSVEVLTNVRSGCRPNWAGLAGFARRNPDAVRLRLFPGVKPPAPEKVEADAIREPRPTDALSLLLAIRYRQCDKGCISNQSLIRPRTMGLARPAGILKPARVGGRHSGQHVSARRLDIEHTFPRDSFASSLCTNQNQSLVFGCRLVALFLCRWMIDDVFS